MFEMHYSYQAVLVLDVLGQRDAVRQTSKVSPEKLGDPGHKGTWAPFRAVATVENIIQQGAQMFEDESRRTQGGSGIQYRWQTNRIGDAITVAGILGRSSADDPMVNIRWLVHTLGLAIMTWTKAAQLGIPLRGGLALDTGIARTEHTDCVYGAAWLAALEMEGRAGYLRVAVDISVLDYLADFEMTIADRFSSAADAFEAKRHLTNCRALITTAPDDNMYVVNVCAAPILEAAGLESVKVRRFVEEMLEDLQPGATEKVRAKYGLTLRLLEKLSDEPILSVPTEIAEEEMSDAKRSEVVSSAGVQAAEAAEKAILEVLIKNNSFDFPGTVKAVALLLSSFAVNSIMHMKGQKTESDLSYAVDYLDMAYKAAKDDVVDRLESTERQQPDGESEGRVDDGG